MLNYDSKQIAEDFFEKLVQYRRYFHQNPELSFQEVNTSAFIKRRLQEMEVPFLERITGNSVVAVIDSGKPGPNIAFRADIDALPIEERNPVPYCSQTPGVMHACGHDGHAAILLCLVEALAARKENIAGKVTCIFQQAEEKLPGGASALIQDGAMDDVDAIFGLHLTGANEVGTVSVTSGPRMASADGFLIKIQGNGGHGSFPDRTGDPVTTAAGIINQMQLLVTKKASPLEPILVNLCGVRSSSFVANIIPTEVELNGMVRCFNHSLRESTKDSIEKIVSTLCEINGCKSEISYSTGYPALISTEEESQTVVEAAESLGWSVAKGQKAMGSDDFARYLLEKPGCYYFVGCRNNEKGIKGVPHTATFDMDEDALKVGLSCMLEVYKTYLNKRL